MADIALPEFLKDETEEVIMQRMLAMVSDDIDKTEGSYIWDSLAPTAAEIAQMKIDLRNFLDRAFATTSFGSYLDYRCEEHGLTRRDAVNATGLVKFTGIGGIIIPAGTVVSTTTDTINYVKAVEFITLTNATISVEGYVTVNIKSTEAGSVGNVSKSVINQLNKPINGVTSVINDEATANGTDIESDTSLLARFLAKVRNPGTSGNKADYKNWALSISMIGDAKVMPLWNGPGTVKVVVIDANKQPASDDLVQDVANYIEGVRPIGATVTVIPATGKQINVDATVILSAGYTIAQVQDLFTQAIVEYFKGIAFQDTYVSYAKIGSILLSTPGVIDYTDLIVNGGAVNIPLGEEDIPILGTVALGV